MTIDNDLINEILKIAYKAVPKKCVLDGTKLIEVHNEMGEFLKIKLLNKAHVSRRSEQLVCSCGGRLVKTTGGYHCDNAKCSV